MSKNTPKYRLVSKRLKMKQNTAEGDPYVATADIRAAEDIRSNGPMSCLRAGPKAIKQKLLSKPSIDTSFRQKLMCYRLVLFAICCTLKKHGKQKTFHIILINSILLHISWPSTCLGRPTVRISSYFIHQGWLATVQQSGISSFAERLAAVQRRVWTKYWE